MSNDFFTAEELAELEAELNELDDSSDVGTLAPALEEAPAAEVITASVEKDTEEEAAFEADAIESELNVAETAQISDDEMTDAELEAEINAMESESLPEQIESPAQAKAKAKELAELEAHVKQKAAAVLEEQAARTGKSTRKEPVSEPVSETGPTDSDDELTEMLLNASTSFNPRQLQKDLAFSDNTLDDAFMSQAGFFAHYSGVAHRAARRYDQLVQQEKLVSASLDNDVRKQAAEDGEKVTETVVRNRILLDPRHRKITDRMLDAKAVAGMTKDACESFKQRRDMLIQVGANVREESKGDLRMRARSEAADERKSHAMDVLRNSQSG